MSTHISDDKRFYAWEAKPEPPIGKPDGTIVLAETDDTTYLWNVKNKDETIVFGGSTMSVEK